MYSFVRIYFYNSFSKNLESSLASDIDPPPLLLRFLWLLWILNSIRLVILISSFTWFTYFVNQY